MKKVQQKHEAHMLIYAVDSNGQLVNVDNVRTGNECGCFCPACKEPLMAKNQGLKKFIILRTNLEQNAILPMSLCYTFLQKRKFVMPFWIMKSF